MRSETINSCVHTPLLRVFEDPYLRVRVDAADHEHIYREELSNWSRSATAYTYTLNKRVMVGLHPKNTADTIDLTKTITLPYDGLYRVEISYRAHPTATGGFQLYDGVDKVEDYQPCHDKYTYLAYRTYRPRYMTAGNHTFKVSVDSYATVRDIVITPIIRFEGDNQGNKGRGDRRLDLAGVDFTQNSVAEVNTATIRLPLRDDYFRGYEWYTPYMFDFNDPVTVWLGETPGEVTAAFGGYVVGASYSNPDLTLNCRDTLLDLERSPLYQNFSIGGAVAEEGSTRPFTPFPSVYELARYLAVSNLYPLKAYLVPYDFAVNIDYSTISDFNSTNVAVWRKYYDLRNGHPAPSLKLAVGDSTGTATATFPIEEFDAHTYNALSLDYYASGAGSRYPLPWNLIVSMYRAGEDEDDALDYTVQVSNGAGTRTLTSHTPTLNGEWQRLSIDLRNLFTSKAPSSEYNITGIRLEGGVGESQLTQRRCSTLWIGGLYTYKSINHAPKYASQDVKTPLEELQQLCERTDHAAYLRFGDTRSDDTLVVSPCKQTTASVAVDETDNLISLESVDYDPLGDEYTNNYHMTFNFDENKGGSSQSFNLGLMSHYREYQRHDFNSDVKTQVDADTTVRTYLSTHQEPQLGFTVNIRGTTELSPEQYAVVSIPSHRLVGSYPVKSLTHSWSKTGGYTTRVDFGKASSRFRSLIRQQQRNLRNLSIRDTGKTYTVGGSVALGGSAPGAFIN